MRKLSKTLLSLLLIAAMLASFVVLPAAAEEGRRAADRGCAGG